MKGERQNEGSLRQKESQGVTQRVKRIRINAVNLSLVSACLCADTLSERKEGKPRLCDPRAAARVGGGAKN